MVYPSHQFQKLSQLETMLEGARAGPLPTDDRMKNRRLADALCHASTLTDKPLANTNRADATVTALKRFTANLKPLMDVPGDAQTILRSSIAFIFRDKVDDWSQIDFSNNAHVEMLETSVTSSLDKLTNPQSRPVNEALNVFFIGLWDLFDQLESITNIR